MSSLAVYILFIYIFFTLTFCCVSEGRLPQLLWRQHVAFQNGYKIVCNFVQRRQVVRGGGRTIHTVVQWCAQLSPRFTFTEIQQTLLREGFFFF